MRSISEIILHCSDTEKTQDWHASDIDRWHRRRGFRCIGYHYVIALDGTLEVGRKESQIGAHCSGHNAHSIGICYIGGKSSGFHDNTLNDAQLNTLCNLLHDLLKRYALESKDIHCHNEYTRSKVCPCFGRDYIYKVIEPILKNCY